jgi:hypothetical protein
MASLRHPAIVWLLLSIVPFQWFIAAYLDLRGPAHFHLHDEVLEHAGERIHSHGHRHVDHHHHPSGDGTVVIAEDDGLESTALEESAAQGRSDASFVALISSSISLGIETPHGLGTKQDRPLQTRFPGRLERPPRIKLS